jgi:hypothetical protein
MTEYGEMYNLRNPESTLFRAEDQCPLRKWVQKYEIVFIPDDSEYENVVLDQYQSYEAATKNLESIKMLYLERGITAFVKKKDRTETKWIRDLTGEIVIQNRPILGCTLF